MKRNDSRFPNFQTLLWTYITQMSKRTWQVCKHNQSLILIFVVSVILYFRLADLWKAGLPYLYYTDEWHMLEPVVRFLSKTLGLHQIHTLFNLFYSPGYYYTLTYLGFFVHPILHFLGIVAEFSDYTDYYYNIIFVARIANLGFLLVTFLFVYRSARLLRLPLAGLVTILQVSVSYPLLRMAGYAKAECFTMMLVAISFYFFLRLSKRKYSQKDYFYTLVFAAVAVCAKLTALTFVVPVLLLSTFLVFKSRQVWTSLRIVGIGLLLAVIAFVAFAPHSLFYAWDMVKAAYSMPGNPVTVSYIYGGARALSVNNLPKIISNFSSFFSSYYLLIFSLVLSLFFIFRSERIYSMLFWLIVAMNCLLFRETFLNPVFSYYTVPSYSVISLCMWYFLLKTMRIGKSFLEDKIRGIKIPLSLCLGLLLASYLVIYAIRDARHFYSFPYSYDIAIYTDRYDCMKSLDRRIPLGASIVFGSRSPKPNPYLYNTKFSFDMSYDFDKYSKFFNEYDYVFSGYSPMHNNPLPFLRDAKISLARGLLGRSCHEFFSTNRTSYKHTPYSMIAKRWIQRYSEKLLESNPDWEAFIDESWIHNGLFSEWDMSHDRYPKNFECTGGTFLIERNKEAHDGIEGKSSIKLSGKNFIFIQNIQDYDKARGRYITLFVQMKTSVPNKFGVQIYDGRGAKASYHPGTARYEEIAVSYKVDEQADRLSIYIVNAKDIGSEEDIVKIRAAILLPGKWRSLKDYQLFFREWQKESGSFWSADFNIRPNSIMHWAIDWDKVDFERDRITNQYFTYIPLSRIPELYPVRHLALVLPFDFKATPEEEIILEFQNISGVVLKKRHIKLNRRLSENSLIVSEPVPFNESTIWNTNIANIKIIYRTKSPRNEIIFPQVILY